MNIGKHQDFAGDVPAAIRRRAAEWLALQQARGFTTREHADFAEWLEADPRHRAAFAEIAAGWTRLAGLALYPHSDDAAPDPDLLAPPGGSRSWSRRSALLAVGAAAAITLVATSLWPGRERPAAPASAASIAEVAPRMLQLPDGSEVELNAGSEVSEHFTAAERRVRLVRGEAHFTVTKDAARPFVVEAGNVRLRALGTAFNVRFEPSAIEVLVTHGRVQVEPPGGADGAVTPPAGPVLEARQRVLVPLEMTPPTPVETVTPADLNRLLAWQTSRIAFENLPLGEVVARLRLASSGPKGPRMTITDPRLTALRISGRVRVDDVEGLVEVLETSFGVEADRRPDGEVVLRLR